MKTLRNIYFAIFGSHLSYSYIVWAENINTVRRLIILHKKALQIMNFKDQLFHSSLLSFNNILKSINREVPSIFNDWFTWLDPPLHPTPFQNFQKGRVQIFPIKREGLVKWGVVVGGVLNRVGITYFHVQFNFSEMMHGFS